MGNGGSIDGGARLAQQLLVDMIGPTEMPPLGTLRVPSHFWWALSGPVPLAAMPYPTSFDWAAVAAAGFSDVVDLTTSHSSYDPAPLAVVGVPLEDLYGGRSPRDDKAEAVAVTRAVDLVVERIRSGRGTIVHCHGGTGRSGTVIGGALVRLGEAPGEVASWLDEVHRARGRGGWPESAWQREMLDRLEQVEP